MITGKFKPPDFSDLIREFDIKSGQINEVAKAAIDETTKFMLKEIQAGYKAKIEERTGKGYKALQQKDAEIRGNHVEGETGYIYDEKYKDQWYLNVLEHGRSNMAPRPFFRPAFEKTKRMMKQISRRVFEKAGIPIE